MLEIEIQNMENFFQSTLSTTVIVLMLNYEFLENNKIVRTIQTVVHHPVRPHLNRVMFVNFHERIYMI